MAENLIQIVDSPGRDAITRVLQTTELLEWIVLQLPNNQILGAQRVSRGWNDLINVSVKIQRALFLKSIIKVVTPRRYKRWDERKEKSYSFTKLLTAQHALDQHETSRTFLMNPLAAYLFPGQMFRVGNQPITSFPPPEPTDGTPTWRSLSVTHPPIGRIDIMLDFPVILGSPEEGIFRQSLEVENEAGVTFGDVVERIETKFHGNPPQLLLLSASKVFLLKEGEDAAREEEQEPEEGENEDNGEEEGYDGGGEDNRGGGEKEAGSVREEQIDHDAIRVELVFSANVEITNEPGMTFQYRRSY